MVPFFIFPLLFFVCLLYCSWLLVPCRLFKRHWTRPGKVAHASSLLTACPPSPTPTKSVSLDTVWWQRRESIMSWWTSKASITNWTGPRPGKSSCIQTLYVQCIVCLCVYVCVCVWAVTELTLYLWILPLHLHNYVEWSVMFAGDLWSSWLQQCTCVCGLTGDILTAPVVAPNKPSKNVTWT